MLDFWGKVFYGVATAVVLRGVEYGVRSLFREKEYKIGDLKVPKTEEEHKAEPEAPRGAVEVQPEFAAFQVELTLIFDQYLGRIEACESGCRLIDEREALFMMAEQLQCLKDKYKGPGIEGVSKTVDLIEKIVVGNVPIGAAAVQLRDAISSGALCV